MAMLEDNIKKFPQAPGIYLFYNSKKELIYVGKATSLRSRVQSYFRGVRSLRPIEQTMHEVTDIKIKQTDSVLEAVILEANYIKKFQPRYNVDGKDDKSWNYIVITDEEFPQVKTLRAYEYNNMYEHTKRTKLRNERDNFLYVFGPYPGLKTREMMKLLQRLFYISVCKPCQSCKPCRPCLYRQMGQCLGVCIGEISSKEYKQKVIRPLVMFLRGNKSGVIKKMEREMKRAGKDENFEEAGRLRNQIIALNRIQDIALLNKSFFLDKKFQISNFKFQIDRIEGYDISNFGSSGKVGSMVVFDMNGPVKAEYRKFKIKNVKGQSDVDCLEEVLSRRLKHADIRITNDANKNMWLLPDIVLIDGGKPQVGVAKKVLAMYGMDIPVIGIAKGPERKKNEFIFGSQERLFIKWVNGNHDLLIQVRDEAHRFAITYQRKLRRL